jgi:hypothetical protein
VANTGTPPRIPPLLVFDESLHPPFQNSSWGSHVFLDNVDVVRSGSIAVRVEFVDWGALDFHSGPMQSGVPIDPLVYDTLQFDVYPLHTFPLTIGFYNGTTVETTITAGTWNHLIVPLRFFGTFDRFYMQRNLSGGDVAFFDNVTLTGFGGAPPTPPRTPDAVRPQVTLLSPQPGAVVHDLASVAVSAVDNIGVAGVQFKVDGAPFGNEDLRPPYETSVNTWYLKNGTHTFSAVARDGSGNRDSASASVTVSNSGTPPNFDLFVFDDALQPPFQNENWGATFTAVTSPVRSGTHSARIDFLTGWGAWDMISGAWGDLIPISPADYDSIALDVYPTSDFALDIGFYRSYNPSFLLTANTWNHISAPLLVDTLITRFWFRKNSAGAATAYFDNVRFVAKSTDKTDGTPAPPLPLEFSLEQNFPNPFNPATSISFSLPRPVQVKLTVFDLLGREVVTLADGPYGAGTYTVRFDPSATGRMASGVYFYRLEAGDFSETRRMVMIR